MADRTRPIVRLDVIEGMVTEGYQKGVYRRVTLGTGVCRDRAFEAVRQRGFRRPTDHGRARAAARLFQVTAEQMSLACGKLQPTSGQGSRFVCSPGRKSRISSPPSCFDLRVKWPWLADSVVKGCACMFYGLQPFCLLNFDVSPCPCGLHRELTGSGHCNSIPADS